MLSVGHTIISFWRLTYQSNRLEGHGIKSIAHYASS